MQCFMSRQNASFHPELWHQRLCSKSCLYFAVLTSQGLWLALQGGAPTQPQFMAAMTLFLAGMGLINPIGTAIALEPFGDQAGIASALLGFLQMAFAAVGTAIIGALPVGPATALAWVVFCGTTLAGAAFLPVLRTARSER